MFKINYFGEIKIIQIITCIEFDYSLNLIVINKLTL